MHQPNRQNQQNQSLESYLEELTPGNDLGANPHRLHYHIHDKVWILKTDLNPRDKSSTLATRLQTVFNIKSSLESNSIIDWWKRDEQRTISIISACVSGMCAVGIVTGLYFGTTVFSAFMVSAAMIAAASIGVVLAIAAVTTLAFFIPYAIYQIQFNKTKGQAKLIAQRLGVEIEKLSKIDNDVSALLKRQVDTAKQKQTEYENTLTQIKLDPAAENSKISKDTFGHVLSYLDASSLRNVMQLNKTWKKKVDTYINEKYDGRGKALIAVCVDLETLKSDVRGLENGFRPNGQYGYLANLHTVPLQCLGVITKYHNLDLSSPKFLSEIGAGLLAKAGGFKPDDKPPSEQELASLDEATRKQVLAALQDKAARDEKAAEFNCALNTLTSRMQDSSKQYLAKALESKVNLKQQGVYFYLEVPADLVASFKTDDVNQACQLRLRSDDYNLIVAVHRGNVVVNSQFWNSAFGELFRNDPNLSRPCIKAPISTTCPNYRNRNGQQINADFDPFMLGRRNGSGYKTHFNHFDKKYHFKRDLRGRGKQKVMFVAAIPDANHPNDVSKLKYFSVHPQVSVEKAIRNKDFGKNLLSRFEGQLLNEDFGKNVLSLLEGQLLRLLKCLKETYSQRLPEIKIYAFEFENVHQYMDIFKGLKAAPKLGGISKQLANCDYNPILSLSFEEKAQANVNGVVGGLFANADSTSSTQLTPVVSFKEGYRLIVQQLFAKVRGVCASELGCDVNDVKYIMQAPLMLGEVDVSTEMDVDKDADGRTIDGADKTTGASLFN